MKNIARGEFPSPQFPDAINDMILQAVRLSRDVAKTALSRTP
jgi:hypothetical protein